MKAQLDSYHVFIPSERAYLNFMADGWCTPDNGWGIAVVGAFPRSRAIELAASVEWPYGRRHVRVVPAPVCACCGKNKFLATLKEVALEPRQWRCEAHIGRNPCLIEGCGRTRAATRPNLTGFICGTHWKLVPRDMRLVYNRIWRLQKKSGGWTDLLVHRYWRIWARICTAAVKASRGEVDLDIAQIEAMFGV